MGDHVFYHPQIAAYYLQEMHNRQHAQKKMRVVFLVQDASVWDKQSPVYDALAQDEEVEVIIVLLPTYRAMDAEAGRCAGKYDEDEWHFFHDQYPDVYDFTNVLDLHILEPDYIFLAIPYEGLRLLRGTRTPELAKIAKLCYIPYATPGTKFFLQTEVQMDGVFSYLMFHFCDSAEEKSVLDHAYALGTGMSVQYFEDLGSPVFETYLSHHAEACEVRRVLWTPRWTMDGPAGGSHFLAYQDAFTQFAVEHGSDRLKFAIRPHPLMFRHMLQRGYMTEQELADYKALLETHGIALDDSRQTPFDALTSADILLTDFSSINMNFFLMDRPMIYCPHDPDLLEDYTLMLEGSYVAETWEQVETHLLHLIRGEDPAALRRREIVAEMRAKHTGASGRIAARLKQDFAEGLSPQIIYAHAAERWIFDRKKELIGEIAGWPAGRLAAFRTQPWYDGYLALLPLRLRSDAVAWGENELQKTLVELYAAEADRERRSCIVLAMLLVADPLQLPVPMEVDLWPDGLYRDVCAIFQEMRMGF